MRSILQWRNLNLSMIYKNYESGKLRKWRERDSREWMSFENKKKLKDLTVRKNQIIEDQIVI